MIARLCISIALFAALVFVGGCEGGNHSNPDTTVGDLATTTRPTTGPTDRPIRALVGGALGAGCGYLIGAKPEKTLDGPDRAKNREAAIQAGRLAERTPARPEAVDRARSADLNDDGFITLDEVLAMRRANLSDQEILRRLKAADQVFDLSDYQMDYLHTRGVSDAVIQAIRNPATMR